MANEMITLLAVASLSVFLLGAILSFVWAASLALRKPIKKVFSSPEKEEEEKDIAGQVIRRLENRRSTTTR